MGRVVEVPETYSLTGDDARTTLREAHWQSVLREAFSRLRAADGFSHARALAFALALLMVEAIVIVVGLAVATGSSAFARTVVDVIEGSVPGPAGQVLTSAVRQAQETGANHQYTALVIGLVAVLVTGATAMGQVERSCNRIYGIEQDRPSRQKYSRAALLALTAGLIGALGTTMLVLGRPVAHAIDRSWAGTLWDLARFPLAVLLLVVGMTVLLKWSPRRRQPGYAWLMYGAALSVLLLVVASLALALFFRWSTTFGDTYGPLAGMIGLLLWCLALAASSLYGVAITAELELVRARRGVTNDTPRVAPTVTV